MKLFLYFFFIALSINGFGQNDWSGNSTPTYQELVTYLKETSSKNKVVELYNMGKSDYGLPIYVCIINGAQDSIQTFKKARKGTTILFNNAIHPGEPDGINACLLWMDEVLANRQVLEGLPLVAFIPAYNIGGMINRSSVSRANQNGPDEYGFRGNAQNLDLNRDFIKMDSKNAFTFARIFHGLDPDVFVDNHVSNGADYQYTLTYISSLKERLAPSLNKILFESLLPTLALKIKEKHSFDLFPYVDLKGKTPDEGIVCFDDLPRYSMGYTSLFQTLSFTVETHMLKPFPLRVKATLAFMKELIDWTAQHKTLIESARLRARSFVSDATSYSFNYKASSYADSILFKGYEHSFPKHKITGLKRLKYDTAAPYSRSIPYHNKFTAQDTMRTPRCYYVGAQEKDVIKRLKANKVKMKKIRRDTLMYLGTYEVIDFETVKRPYEGHFQLKNINTMRSKRMVKLKQGDVVIKSNQDAAAFIHSVLQPETEDSYLCWNFFDSYLQQKEHFSSYVFVDKIEEILNEDPELEKIYKKKMKEDEGFKKSEWEQLYFIYRGSKYFEKTLNILPVYFLD